MEIHQTGITCVLQDACNTHVMLNGAMLVVFHFGVVQLLVVLFCFGLQFMVRVFVTTMRSI